MFFIFRGFHVRMLPYTGKLLAQHSCLPVTLEPVDTRAEAILAICEWHSKCKEGA